MKSSRLEQQKQKEKEEKERLKKENEEREKKLAEERKRDIILIDTADESGEQSPEIAIDPAEKNDGLMSSFLLISRFLFSLTLFTHPFHSTLIFSFFF